MNAKQAGLSTILVVEDYPDSRTLLSSLLRGERVQGSRSRGRQGRCASGLPRHSGSDPDGSGDARNGRHSKRPANCVKDKPFSRTPIFAISAYTLPRSSKTRWPPAAPRFLPSQLTSSRCWAGSKPPSVCRLKTERGHPVRLSAQARNNFVTGSVGESERAAHAGGQDKHPNGAAPPGTPLVRAPLDAPSHLLSSRSIATLRTKLSNSACSRAASACCVCLSLVSCSRRVSCVSALDT